jgi:hypothetical protein
MIASDERHDFNLGRLETPQIAVLDQIVRMLVVARVTDVHADVMHQARVFEPLACPIGETMHRSRLIEERQRQPRHLMGVLGPISTPFA